MKRFLIEKRSFFSRPNRIPQDGPSKFFFYDHTAFGKNSINLISSIVEPGIRSHLSLPISAVNEKEANLILSDLQRNGIATFPLSQIADGDKILADLSAEWDALEVKNKNKIDETKKKTVAKDQKGEKPYIYSMSARRSIGAPHWRLALHPDILYLVNSYMSAYSKIFGMQYILNFPMRDKTAIRSQIWHRDGDGTVLKLFVYLNDVSGGNGPFTYAPGSHISPFRQINYKERPKTDDELRKLLNCYTRDFVMAIGQKGTAVLANTSGMHKGGHVSEGERKALLIAYYPPWIDRSDYGLRPPNDFSGQLHPAQRAAMPKR
jgi:hypothetical protein